MPAHPLVNYDMAQAGLNHLGASLEGGTAIFAGHIAVRPEPRTNDNGLRLVVAAASFEGTFRRIPENKRHGSDAMIGFQPKGWLSWQTPGALTLACYRLSDNISHILAADVPAEDFADYRDTHLREQTARRERQKHGQPGLTILRLVNQHSLGKPDKTIVDLARYSRDVAEPDLTIDDEKLEDLTFKPGGYDYELVGSGIGLALRSNARPMMAVLPNAPRLHNIARGLSRVLATQYEDEFTYPSAAVMVYNPSSGQTRTSTTGPIRPSL